MKRKSPRRLVLVLGLVWTLLGLAGCHDPEDGRPRGGGHGGDGGNYVRGRVHPPSKIDGTKDLSLLQHDGPRPRRAGPTPAFRRPGVPRGAREKPQENDAKVQ